MIRINLTGKVFGSLTVISLDGKNRHGGAMWLCLCACGNNHTTYGSSLKSGRSKSCGCNTNVKHGLSKTPEHRTWCRIKDRCYNPNYKGFKDYGLRGIVMSDEWKNSFSAFLSDMGKRPSVNHSIERNENDGNYCKENCRWATKKEQARNTRSNVFIETKWGNITIAEAAEKSGISAPVLYRKRKTGKPIIEVL